MAALLIQPAGIAADTPVDNAYRSRNEVIAERTEARHHGPGEERPGAPLHQHTCTTRRRLCWRVHTDL